MYWETVLTLRFLTISSELTVSKEKNRSHYNRYLTTAKNVYDSGEFDNTFINDYDLAKLKNYFKQRIILAFKNGVEY